MEEESESESLEDEVELVPDSLDVEKSELLGPGSGDEEDPIFWRKGGVSEKRENGVRGRVWGRGSGGRGGGGALPAQCRMGPMKGGPQEPPTRVREDWSPTG